MILTNPDNNLLGSEPKKKIKFRVVKNAWIDVKDYKYSKKHELLCDTGFMYSLDAVGFIAKLYKKSVKQMLADRNVKRVMILSRK